MQPGAQVRPGLLVAAEIEFQTCIGAYLLLARGRLGGQHRMHIILFIHSVAYLLALDSDSLPLRRKGTRAFTPAVPPDALHSPSVIRLPHFVWPGSHY